MPTDPVYSSTDFLRQTYATATLMAREGEYDLALRLLRAAIERAHVDREIGRPADAAVDASRADIERQLTEAYAAFKAKVDDGRRPWQEALAKTAIITSGVALTFIVCFGFAMYRLDALIQAPVERVVTVLQGAVDTQLPRVTNRVVETIPDVSAQVNREIQNTSMKFSAYLEKKVDQALDERIGQIVDEKLKAKVDTK